MSSFTPAQRAMAIAPKCTGFISLCASTYIVQHVLRDKKRRNLTYHRLLCGMSISDMFGSFMCFLSTWPIPRGEAFLASGTVQTCAAQGFFNQSAALCTPTYNISLAIYYLLVVVGGWKEKRVEGIEKYLHALPIVAGLGTGIAGLVLKLFNGAGWICWIAPGLPNNPERHNPSYGIYRLAFLYADAWAIIVFLAVTMAVIYYHVLKQERSLDKYCTNSFATKKRKQSKKIRNQAFLYVAVFFLTYVWTIILRFMSNQGSQPDQEPRVYPVMVLRGIFLPMMGLFTVLVYSRPRYLQLRTLNQDRRILFRIQLRLRILVGDQLLTSLGRIVQIVLLVEEAIDSPHHFGPVKLLNTR